MTIMDFFYDTCLVLLEFLSISLGILFVLAVFVLVETLFHEIARKVFPDDFKDSEGSK